MGKGIYNFPVMRECILVKSNKSISLKKRHDIALRIQDNVDKLDEEISNLASLEGKIKQYTKEIQVLKNDSIVIKLPKYYYFINAYKFKSRLACTVCSAPLSSKLWVETELIKHRDKAPINLSYNDLTNSFVNASNLLMHYENIFQNYYNKIYENYSTIKEKASVIFKTCGTSSDELGEMFDSVWEGAPIKDVLKSKNRLVSSFLNIIFNQNKMSDSDLNQVTSDNNYDWFKSYINMNHGLGVRLLEDCKVSCNSVIYDEGDADDVIGSEAIINNKLLCFVRKSSLDYVFGI